MFKFRLGTLRARLLISFILIALLPVLSATVGSIAVGMYNGRKQTLGRLESVAISKELAIREWLESLHQELIIVSITDNSYERMWVVLSLARDDKYYDFYNKAVRNRLRAFVGQSQLLEELFLIDANGRVALSTDTSQEGREVSEEDYFRQGLKGPFTSLPFYPKAGIWGSENEEKEKSPNSLNPARNSVVTVALPIIGEAGQVVGVIAGRAKAETLNGLLHDGTGLGESGKAYMVNADRALLVGSLLVADRETSVVSGQALRTWMAEAGAALDARANGSAFYDDYYGEPVIGVFRWLPEVEAILFVEQDQSEALGVMLTTLSINLAVALTALLLAIVLSLAMMRGITNALENLAETATLIAAGDLDRHARVEREDEIGQLARAFNSMTAQLRELIADLEQRVADRTGELQRLALQMETSAQVSREVTSILAIDALLSKVTELIESAFGYYGVHIYLVDQAANRLVFRASSQSSPPHDSVLEIGSGSLNGEVVRLNQELLANDVSLEPRYRLDPNYPDTRSELVIPLRFGSRIIGTLDLLSAKTDAFRPEDVVIAQSLGDQIAIAIENARLYERSQELAVMEERNRLAREVHDAMNQSLYSIILFAGAAHKEAEKAGLGSIQRHLTRVEGMAQQALKEMRLMIYELRPQELEEKGMIGALQQRLDAVEASAGLDVELAVEGEFGLPPRTEEVLYRIVQEALNNVLKHAAASSVKVSIRTLPAEPQGEAFGRHQIEIAVADNGVGFDPEQAGLGDFSEKSPDPLIPARNVSPRPNQRMGLGLASMRQRADELGAALRIQSAPGEGTCVQLLVKLPSG
jgi:nitrate/nitrite-specific signal transduction histidine kinase